MTPAPLTLSESAYLRRMRRCLVCQTLPGFLVLMAVGGLMLAGAVSTMISPVPEDDFWLIPFGIAIGLLFLGFGGWVGFLHLNEWLALGHALKTGKTQTHADPIQDVDAEKTNALFLLIQQLSPRAKRLKMGKFLVVLPRLEWFPFLNLNPEDRRGVEAHKSFYLLDSGSLSVERQVPIGLLETRLAGFYVFAAGLLLFLGIGFLLSDNATPTILRIGLVATAIGIGFGIAAFVFRRRNRRFAEALRQQVEPFPK